MLPEFARSMILCTVILSRKVHAHSAIIKIQGKHGGVYMSFFDFFKQPDVNQGVNEYQKTSNAVLLDVRTPAEYRSGHIPGSKNISLDAIDSVGSVAENKDTALYVYCQSGARSRQAAGLLRQMGYTNVNNIGGIAAYAGKVER